MVKRVNNSIIVSTPDFVWNNEKWDLKKINWCGKNTLKSAIKNKNVSLKYIKC